MGKEGVGGDCYMRAQQSGLCLVYVIRDLAVNWGYPLVFHVRCQHDQSELDRLKLIINLQCVLQTCCYLSSIQATL